MSGLPVKFELIACFVLSKVEAGYSLLFLTRTPADSHAPGTAQIVYGHIENGESAEDTVLREITEETGLIVASLYSLNETFSFYDKISRCMQIVPVFIAFVNENEPAVGNCAEHSGYEWIRLEDAHQHLPWQAQQRVLDVLTDLLDSGCIPERMRLDITQSGIVTE